MRWRSILRWVGGACAVVLLLFLGIILSAPLWIDATAVKAKVVSIVNKATDGQARIERVDLHFLPRPGVVLTRPGFTLPGTFELEAKSASVDLDFVALLKGHVHPRNIRIDSPSVRVQLPEPQPKSGDQSFSFAQAEQQVRTMVDGIIERSPGAHVELVDASLALRIGQRPPLLLEHLAIELGVEGDAVKGQLSCGANLWERLVIDARLTGKDLVGEGHAQVSGLHAERLGAMLGNDNWPVSAADVSATLRWQMHGLADAQADVTLSAAKLMLQSGNRRFEAVGPVLEAAARFDKGTMGLTVRRLALETPHLEATGKLSWSPANGYMLEAQTKDVDVPALLVAARDLAPEIDWLARPRVIIERGTISSLAMRSRGASLDTLVSLASLQAVGELSGVAVRVPEWDLRLREGGATASLAAGELRIEHIAAHAGKSSMREGSLVTKLGAEPMPLHADITADLDLSEALATARRMIHDRSILRRLDQVKRLDGSAVVHVTLGESLDRLRLRVDVSALQASAQHEAIPFPIRIARGALHYADDALAVHDLDGAIGQSTFAGVGVRIGLKAPYVVSKGRGSAVLALAQLFRWAQAQPDLAKRLEGVATVSGGLALTLNRLDGPVRTPKALQFRLSATPKRMVVHAPRYAPQVALDGGSIDLTPRSISAQGIKVSALDATVAIGAHTEDYQHGINNLSLTASGSVGLEALTWAFARAHPPEGFRLRDALTLSDVRADWSKRGKMTARGSLSIAGGPVIGFAANRTLQRLEIENVTVRDEASDASFGGSVEGTRFEARFKGRLAGTSIEHVFARLPGALGTMEGDFRGNGDWTNPGHGEVTGFLTASNIRLPVSLPDPVMIEQLSLQAKESVITIKSARVASGESRIEISGSIDTSKEKFLVDADIRGDTVVIPMPPPKDTPKSEAIEPGKEQESAMAGVSRVIQIIDQMPVAGAVRVDIAHLRRGRMEIAPLIGSGSLQTGRLDLRVKSAALCAIALSGGLTAKPDHIDVKVTLSARGAELDRTIACLTEQRIRATGRLDMDAQLATSGKLDTLPDRLQGTFSAVAREGRIDKFDALSKAFELLNVTEAVHGKLPDLKQKGMGYKSAHVKGRIQGRKIFLDEAVLDASAAKLAAQGWLDTAAQTIDVNVLVAPLQTLNWILDKIPILRQIMGGTVLALPVHVGGTFKDPRVVPLSTQAVASRMIDIIANTLKLPADLVNTLSPESARDGKTPQQ